MAVEVLSWAVETLGASFAIATSYQNEGMVVADPASKISQGVRIFTLDTGPLPHETFRMTNVMRERVYGAVVEIVCPDAPEVQQMVREHWPNLFYGSVEARRLCCEVRKAGDS